MLACIFKLWSDWRKLPAHSAASVRPKRNLGSHFLTVTMEFELDFKLKSRVFTKKLVHGDPWTLAQTAESKWLGSSSYSFTLRRSGFRKHILEHRRRHRWRRFCILHIIGPRSHINSMRWQSLCDMLDTAKAPRRVAQGDRASEDMENITDDTQNCWGNAHRSGPLSPNKLQQYLSGLCMVNWAEFEFRPSIKKHHVHETIFFSYQFDLWHHLKYICCRFASVAKPPWVERCAQELDQITSRAWNNFGTLLSQPSQL